MLIHLFLMYLEEGSNYVTALQKAKNTIIKGESTQGSGAEELAHPQWWGKLTFIGNQQGGIQFS